jgi:hypothetical protein
MPQIAAPNNGNRSNLKFSLRLMVQNILFAREILLARKR